MTHARLHLPRLILVGVLAIAMAIGAAAFLLVPDRTVDQLQLVIAPHPDDEFLAFPALDDAPGTYTVVVSLTRGEDTSRCDNLDRYLQSDLGERPPEPRPESRQSAECAQARRDSWIAFLNDAGSHTGEVRLGPGRLTEVTRVVDTRFGGEAEIWRGKYGGRALLSLRDGQLTERDVEAALEGVLALRGTTLPDLPVKRVVLASYWRPADETVGSVPGGLIYANSDHHAVTLAAPAIARHARADVWVNVPPDFAVALGAATDTELMRASRALPPQTYQAYMALETRGEDGATRRTGALQVNYGWLAFPGQTWAAGEVPDQQSGVLFARVQDYLIVEAP